MRMHHSRPLPSYGRPHNKNGSDDGAAASAGPTSHDGSYKAKEEEGGGGGGHGVVSAARTLQPFSTTAFESPGMMAASLRFPFTSAQWQELERQALIYKYMMASAPVPPDLLMPICRHFSDNAAAAPLSALGRSSCFNLRFSSGMDPEPGRCRRTDGKKWRCSRDAAPDQKYCERHMHRGRPRSRKPVELHLRAGINNIDGKKWRSAPITPPETPSPCLTNISSNNTTSNHQLSGLLCRSDFKASPFDNLLPLASYKESRGVDWMMKGETVPIAASNQQWPQLMYSKANASAFRQPYEGDSSLNSYSNFGVGEGPEAPHQNDQCFLFLNPEIASLGEPSSPEQQRTPRQFIDAWSTSARPNTGSKSSICTDGKLPPSALTLSMPGGNVSNEDRDQIQMGLGVNASSSWTTSPLGGPLAEVLRPSLAHGCCGGGGGGSSGKISSCGGGGLNLMSVRWGTSGDIAGSPRATTDSSRSEVLQQTLASVSDGSGGSSSPAF
ncbi:growth-regulating factor 7-like isoform X2 [Telopea speciosissima]|uniref:growth-regulating factor 7-like isoform X2 n=1 Tax=Telopea speciosissima TaxID=54955 RepID=UPI001CC58A7E|nr:growth-regulating factor 7-like isoform X2 [Telopea speciosissima]